MNKDFKKPFRGDFKPSFKPGFKGGGGFRKPSRTIGTIIDLKDGDYFQGFVKIMGRAVPGPVIFTVSDGYGSVDAVIKESEFQVDDIVELEGKAGERAGRLQVEIDRITRSNKDFSEVINENSKPVRTEFSIKSERFEKLKYLFLKISQRIRKAILENQPIMIRHHADSDGINAGLAIEHSCRGLMSKIGINPDYNLYRSPSKAPYYEISDVFRDVVLNKRIIESHGHKKPLIIVLDNGSTPEDVFGVKTLKSLGFEIIVIDHHNPVIIENKKTAVDPYISLHLNPYIEGLNSEICAAMLAYELGRMIFEEYENRLLPAVAAISDRSKGKEVEDYIKNSGEDKKFLEKIGTAIDFISYNLKYDAGKGLYEELYANKELVEGIIEEVKKGFETQLQSTLPYLRTQDIEGVIFSYIDLEKYTMRFKFPAPGRVVGMIHDTISAEKEHIPHITIGHLSDMIILRATKPVLPVAKIIKRLQKDIPNAHAEGGGHEMAGAIKFVPAHLIDIIENLKKQIKEVNYLESSQEGKEEK